MPCIPYATLVKEIPRILPSTRDSNSAKFSKTHDCCHGFVKQLTDPVVSYTNINKSTFLAGIAAFYNGNMTKLSRLH